MKMLEPMLAVPTHKGTIANWTDWVFEQKHDGFRLMVSVRDGKVLSWGRPRQHAGGAGKTMMSMDNDLSVDMVAELALLPDGVYDGELIAGTTSTDVRRTDLRGSKKYIVFDIITSTELMPSATWLHRRAMLEACFDGTPLKTVELSQVIFNISQDEVKRLVAAIWEQGGEGAILKRKGSVYQPGKRSPDWIKVKKCQHAVLTVVGFEPSRGTVRHPGHPFAIVVLRDDAGHETTVKTKDDAELHRFELQQATIATRGDGKTHPAIGRKLMIEYQDRTRDQGYRHPRWDRWEDE